VPIHTEPPSGVRLCEFIRDRQADILLAWERLVRAEPAAAELTAGALRNHLPRLLTLISAAVETVHEGGEVSVDQLAELHALDRLDLGYDLGALVTEYKLLRACVLQLYAREVDRLGVVEEIERFDACIDDAIRISVSRYGNARGRTLLALDRFTKVAAGSSDLPRLLPELLRVVVETVDAVDMGAIFLVERDRLKVAASVGMPEDFPNLELALGEGFGGSVAAEGRPLELRDASRSPVVRLKALPPDTKALYGVPLLDEGRVIGVAYMGSRSANEFAAADTILLRAMASRASAFIVQARLRDAEVLERRRADAHARLLDAILRELPVGVAVAEAPSGRVTVSNAAFERLLRRPVVHARNVSEYAAVAEGFWPDGRPVAPEEWPLARAVSGGERAEGAEIAVVRGDGTRAITIQSAAPVRDDAGQVVAAVAAYVDITERKGIEDQLRASAEFRESFIGILSHDLRNLVSVISGTARVLLARAPVDQPTSAKVERISRASDRMARMIRDLLDFTRGRLGGGIPVTPQPTNLGDLCAHVVDELRAAKPDREIRLGTEGELSGTWDPDRVAQAVSNLCNNAMDYGAPGTPVDVRATGGPAEVEVSVANVGDPIAPEALATLFDPYRRASERKSGTGLGLGLFIVREIARAHGGTVEASASDGRVTFSIRLPRAGPASATRPVQGSR
jgi:signal transduction histidine kinase